MKLAERYGNKKAEIACEHMLALSGTPSIRSISSILKNSFEKSSSKKGVQPDSNKYGITRGAAYFKKGGDSND